MKDIDGFKPQADKGIKRCQQIFNSPANPQFDVFQYNMMSETVEYTKTPLWRPDRNKGQEVTKTDESLIRAHLSEVFNFDAKKTDIMDAVIEKAFRNPVYPLRDYLDSLVWDGTSRLDTWLIDVCGADDNVYTRAVGRKFLTASIKRLYEPGCQFDYMLVLEGAQGIKKSSLLKTLGGEWFAQLSIESDATSLMENMCGKWFIEFDEMSGWSKTDVEKIKSLITRQVDRRRVPYDRNSGDFKRKCILAGTLNPKINNQYLNDETGNRRFWIIECHIKEINIGYVEENRDQLFAEAKYYYENKEKLWLINEEEISISNKIQEDRMISHSSWEEIIAEKLSTETDEKIKVNKILTNYIGMRAERINISCETRVGIIMAKMKGWRKEREADGRREYFYERDFISNTKKEEQEEW